MLSVSKANCLDFMKNIGDASIDCIICDPPYGITQNSWDAVIPFDDLWDGFKRIIKPRGTIIMFGAGIFSAKVALSNEKWWRYKWVWEKSSATGFLNAKKMPLRSHEDIHVFAPQSETLEEIHIFYPRIGVYNPQKTEGHPPVNSFTKHPKKEIDNYGVTNHVVKGGGNTDRYPRDVIRFPMDKQTSALHRTQKPLDLIRYLVKTYTNEGDYVFDPTAGSGTTGVACIMEKRKFTLVEKDEEIFKICKERVFKSLQEHGGGF